MKLTHYRQFKYNTNIIKIDLFYCLDIVNRIIGTCDTLVYTRKMVPIKGRASASFSSMLKL